MKVIDRTLVIGEEPQLFGPTGLFTATLTRTESDQVDHYRLVLRADTPAALPSGLCIRWRLPAVNVKGEWSPGALYEKRIRADWEYPSVVSRVSVNAPVLCLFGHQDENIVAFACSEVIEPMELEAPVREEDNFIYCQLRFFTEPTAPTTHYQADLYIDRRHLPFYRVLHDISQWWANFTHLQPIVPPPAARYPVYSTWYSFHQNLTAERLLEECKIAVDLGYRTLIVDDGWQTLDQGRGYDYTGDWAPERLSDPAAFVAQVHQLGMQCLFWYSVPFCGKKSQAYQQFRGKFLTENHPWAPVFDPRYPEVREYLISKYTAALQDWNLDGFKLDFIDDFRTYAETELAQANGRDCASVNEGVDRLLSAVIRELRAIKPEVLIEFRQKYIGPAMRKYGNLFRAFDCPYDTVANRLRTTDVRLTSGATVVHADMLTWHPEESVEIAALQLASVLFSVPQLSVDLSTLPAEHHDMIAFYTDFWLQRQAILLDGEFRPVDPLANYPILCAATATAIVYGIYADRVIDISANYSSIDLVNGKATADLVVRLREDLGQYQLKSYNCRGQLMQSKDIELGVGLHTLSIPSSGIVSLEKHNLF